MLDTGQLIDIVNEAQARLKPSFSKAGVDPAAVQGLVALFEKSTILFCEDDVFGKQ